MRSEHIRVTMHSTLQKIGRRPDPKALALSDQLQDPNLPGEAAANHIKVIGLPLTYAQERALHAVQILFDETDYEGNAPPRKMNRSQRYHFDGKLPVLEVKTADFLRAYGVKVSRTARGIEFGSARRIALGALRDLAGERYLLAYEKARRPGSEKKVRVEAVAPLLMIDWSNGGRRIRIVPNPVLVDQVESFFALMPRELFELVPDKDAAKIRFLEFLIVQAEMKRRTGRGKDVPDIHIRLTSEAIAWNLRLDKMIRGRKKTALREKLKELYEFGVKVGYLESFELDQPATKGRKVDVLVLNKKTFNYLSPVGAKSTTRKRKILHL
jgi:hypothetical protein